MKIPLVTLFSDLKLEKLWTMSNKEIEQFKKELEKDIEETKKLEETQVSSNW